MIHTYISLSAIICFLYNISQSVASTCAAATDATLCSAATCMGVWDTSAVTCYDCALGQSVCENDCTKRWIQGACVEKCTNAVSAPLCTSCYGSWQSPTCYDCMQDQSTCQDICSRFWINSKCWDCSSSPASCTDVPTCNGEWDSTNLVCEVCWTNKNACQTCNRFWDIVTASCVNCQLDQATCEDPAYCNGYWSAGKCVLCFLNKPNCEGSLCGGTWDSINDKCTNCSKDSRQCTLCSKNWILNTCIDCNSGFNTCTDIKYCNGEWNVSTCTICNLDQPTCEITGAGNCNGVWQALPQTCNKCDNNLTECTKCQLDWIPGIANTCVDCSQSAAYCQNTAICNGVWDPVALSCQVCNSDTDTCSQCINLRTWDPTVPSTNLCINCFEDSAKCSQCNFFWVPSNSNYDISIQGTCVNCNSSEEMCTLKTMCNGSWNAGSSYCQTQCNRKLSDCSGCGGIWDATNLLCNVCSKTQSECQSCGRQWVVQTCQICTALPACTNALCGGLWNSTTGTCLVCNENSTNCKSCGGFWNNSQCLMCDKTQTICASCGGIYDYANSICILTNDKFTCLNMLPKFFESPYWNLLKCFDCNESQYVCNKECFRDWENQSCSATSCDFSAYYCESLCHQNWNYYTDTCFNFDIHQHSICFVSNDSVMLNGQCIQCHASKDLCEAQCNNAYSPSIGTRSWTNGDCTNCQFDQTTCNNICKMDWITITIGGIPTTACIKCDADQYSCGICQGQWNSTTNVCISIQSYCNTNSITCMNQCAYYPKQQFYYSPTISQCIYCSLNEFTCTNICNSLWLPRQQYCEVLDSQDRCQLNNRGFWDSATSTCKICADSAANCATCGAKWDTASQLCNNINLGQSYCVLAGDNYIWITDAISTANNISLANGRCISCDTSLNVCNNACKRDWDSTNNLCLTCSSSKNVCENKCSLNWIPTPPSTYLPSGSSLPICINCSKDYDTCSNTCQWYWKSSTGTCVNCGTSLAICQDTTNCNGYWDSGTSTCLLCNAGLNNCENKCFFIWSSSQNSCINCTSSQTICEQSCGYKWVAGTPGSCTLCNKNQTICEASPCSGFWLATNKCTQIKCNQNENTCVNKCLMKWNSKLGVCQPCDQTQYLSGSNCLQCTDLTTSANCTTYCQSNQFFWDATITGTKKCRECLPTEYWNTSTNSCKTCISIDPLCTTCKLVGTVGTCTACSGNYKVVASITCKCIGDRILNASSVCTLCSILISQCTSCSVLGTCDTCTSGYSLVSGSSQCRAQYTFTSNTLTGISFVTDFQVILNYSNAYNPHNQAIVYDGYFIDPTSFQTNLSNKPNWISSYLSSGVLYTTGLSQLVTYTLKLKSGKYTLAPLLLLDGVLIYPEDPQMYINFDVTKAFNYIDQYTKYVNSVSDFFTPKDYYFRMFADEFEEQYYQVVCSNCVNSVTCLANRFQCDCSSVTTSSGKSKTLYDCSGLDYTDFNIFATTLFSYFMKTAGTNAESYSKVKQLTKHLLTADNVNMNVEIFEYWSSLIPLILPASPTTQETLIHEELIRRTVTYTNKMEQLSLASTSKQLILPHDNILTSIQVVMGYEQSYTLETLSYVKYSASSLISSNAIIKTVEIKKLITGASPAIYSDVTQLSPSGSYKVARFFYKLNPFFIGNSTFTAYVNYPFIEHFVYSKQGASFIRVDTDFTITFNVTSIKSSTKCAQREGDFLQLCANTSKDSIKLAITCTCKNSATLIEKTILVEPDTSGGSGQNYTLFIILGSVLGSALVCFLLFLFYYLKRIKEVDKFIILKKTRAGTRAVDPNLSLDDYDLEVKQE